MAGRFDLEQYETVQDRIIRFYKMFPEGRIYTERIYGDDRRFEFKAYLYRNYEDNVPMATGHAEEIVGASPVNKTSAAENCETSAIGRAISNSILALTAPLAAKPSRSEMEKVERYEKEPRKPIYAAKILTAEELARLEKILEEIYTLNEVPRLRKIWEDNKDFLDHPIKGTTIKDALNKRVQELS